MTRTDAWAVVPVKPLSLSKLRLASVLCAGDRRRLSLAMLYDVITALKQVQELGAVSVISRDDDVVDFVRKLGVRTLRETSTGENAAVAEAARTFAVEGCGTMLVVPSDVPLATPAELAAIVQAQRAASTVTLVPDRDRMGTNALALSPPNAIAPCFGKDSLARHQVAARDAGLGCTVMDLFGLGLDVDLPSDLAGLMQRDAPTRTNDCLRKLLERGRIEGLSAESL